MTVNVLTHRLGCAVDGFLFLLCSVSVSKPGVEGSRAKKRRRRREQGEKRRTANNYANTDKREVNEGYNRERDEWGDVMRCRVQCVEIGLMRGTEPKDPTSQSIQPIHTQHHRYNIPTQRHNHRREVSARCHMHCVDR